MAVRTVVCPECDAPVPYGRLSCPSCGALLASVAGGATRSLHGVAAAVPVADFAPPVALADPAEPAVRVRRSRAIPGAVAPAQAEDTRDPVPDTTPPPDEVEPVSAPGDLDDVSEPAPPEVELPGDREPERPSWPGPTESTTTLPVHPAPRPAPPAESAPASPPDPVAPIAGPAVGGSQPAWTTSEPVVASAAVEVARTPAGAWLPPSAAFGPSVPNGAVAGDPIAAAAAAPASRVKPGVASLFADLPFDAPDDLPGWVVTIGSAIAVAGFFLPWAAVIPFFTTGLGYTDRWGFAISSHVLVFLGVLGLLVLTILPNRLPAWFRLGPLPLALGGLLLGVVWPFVIGGIGAQIGALSVAFGGLLLIAGGVLAVRPARHGRRAPPV